MMEVDPSSSPPIEENSIADENHGDNSNSTPGSNEQVTESGTPIDDYSELWLNFKCVFCNQDLKQINRPKLLQCLHTACESCLASESNSESSGASSSAGNKQLTCPACSQEINTDDIVDHLFLIEYVQNSESLPEENSFPCTSCEEGAEGSAFCQECQEWLCDTCVSAHHRVRVTKDHTVRPKEEMEGENIAGRNQKYLFCQTHSHEQLKLYCETCDKLTCRDCQLSNHKEHKYQFLAKACEEEKGHITELLAKIKEKQSLIENASSNLNKRNEEILEREKALTQEVKTFAVKFITDINKRGKALLQDLYKVCSEKKSQLNMKNQELSSVAERLQHCQKFVEAAMSLGSETALVYSKKPIMTQLRRILRHRCEVPNPNDVVDIVFNYETNFLSQYISSLGQILVDQQPIPGATANQNAMLPMPRTAQSPVLNNPAPIPRQPPPMQVQQQRMVQQMNQHPVQQMNQQAMAPYGQPQVTSSTDLNRNHQIRQINKQMQYNRNHMQRANVQQNPQATFAMQGNNAITQSQMIQQSVNQQMRQHPQVQQRQQPQQQHQQQQQQQIQHQQLQQQHQQQQQQIQQSNFNNTAQLPIPLRQNKSISVTAVPSPSGPSPNKQRAIAPRNINMSVVNNQASPSVQRTNSNQTTPQRSNAPQVIVLDDHPNQKTPTMSNTTRLSHFPNNIAATLAANHPNLQIQPTGFNNSNLPNQILVNIQQGSQSNLFTAQNQAAILAALRPAIMASNRFNRPTGPHTNPPPPYPSLVNQLNAPVIISNQTQIQVTQQSTQPAPQTILTPIISSVSSEGSSTINSSSYLKDLLLKQVNVGAHSSPVESKEVSNIARQVPGSENRQSDKESKLEVEKQSERRMSSSSSSNDSLPPVSKIFEKKSKGKDSSSSTSFMTKNVKESPGANSDQSDDKESSCGSPHLPAVKSSSGSPVPSAVNIKEYSSGSSSISDIKGLFDIKSASEDSFNLSQYFKENCRTDPNDDYCAVCKDGGDLVCCGFCPKVFHFGCHVPPIPLTLNKADDWRCRLCVDILKEPIPNENVKRKTLDLQGRDLMICEKILLEILSHPNSAPFHNRVCKKVPNYYRIIKKPMELETMKMKISPSHFEHYKTVEEFIDDMILILSNCYTYNPKDTALYTTGKQIELFFKNLLMEYLPKYVPYFSEDKLLPRPVVITPPQ